MKLRANMKNPFKQLIKLLLILLLAFSARAGIYDIPSVEDSLPITVNTSIINIFSNEKAIDAILLYSYRCELITQGNRQSIEIKTYKEWNAKEIDAFYARYGALAKPVVSEFYWTRTISPPTKYY